MKSSSEQSEGRKAACRFIAVRPITMTRDSFEDLVKAFDESRREALGEVREAADKFNDIIDTIEGRCMAADGPVTPTLQEMTEKELRSLWLQVRKIRALIKES